MRKYPHPDFLEKKRDERPTLRAVCSIYVAGANRRGRMPFVPGGSFIPVLKPRFFRYSGWFANCRGYFPNGSRASITPRRYCLESGTSYSYPGILRFIPPGVGWILTPGTAGMMQVRWQRNIRGRGRSWSSMASMVEPSIFFVCSRFHEIRSLHNSPQILPG